MTRRSFRGQEIETPPVPSPSALTRSVEPRTVYDSTVVAIDVMETVRSAGGWMVDRARAAWRVTALVSPDRLQIIHWLESVQGLPNPEALKSLLSIVPADRAFLCGPAPFMEAAQASTAANRFC